MSKDKGPKVPLNVFVDKQKSKVLFAEANNDFTDILLSFLTLPLGKLLTILGEQYADVFGSLPTLYSGLGNLNISHFCDGWCFKDMMLNPLSSFNDDCCRLKLDISSSELTKYYFCEKYNCGKSAASNASLYYGTDKCDCGCSLKRSDTAYCHGNDGVFTLKVLSFIICDDLRVVPNVSGFLQTVTDLGITDSEDAELRSLSLGKSDILDLLKFSLISHTPLTDLVLKNNPMISKAPKPFLGNLFPYNVTDGAHTRKMILKVSLQKSTDRFLFSQATGEFIEFLFSLLTVHLGGVGCLLDGSTSFKSIDNLYTSVRDVIDYKYFKTPDIKSRLVSPELPHRYITKNQFLPLFEASLPVLYHGLYGLYSNNETATLSSLVSFKSKKPPGNFVMQQAVYNVSDDLIVTPYSISSTISIIKGQGIPFSDVKEMELHVGLQEAIRILEASLTSKTVITDALIKPFLNKLPKLKHQPKQER